MSVEVAELDLGDDRDARAARGAAAGELRGRGAADRRGRAAADARDARRSCAPAGETFLGARRDGRLVGAVSFKRAGGTVDIHRLVVDPGAFRGGVATALLDALEAREAGATHWTVGTGAANAPARALYERRGFEATEERDRARRHPLGAHGPGGRDPSR